MENSIRLATVDDGAAILKIYSYYIENTAVSFETEVLSIYDFKRRIEVITEKYPYLVFLSENEIAGFAYASKYGERAAYRFDVGTSVYVMEKYHGQGVASKLYESLFYILAKQGFYNAYVKITIPNEKSIGLHKKFGFTEVGVYHNAGYKFGKWHDLMSMEKNILPYINEPKEIKTIKELQEGIIL